MTVRVSKLRVSITSAVAVRPSTLYSIKIDHPTIGSSYCVRHSYSDFYTIRMELIRALRVVPQNDVVHPLMYDLFPRRSLFGSRRGSVVKYRVVALQQFLRAALACIESRSVSQCPPVQRIMEKTMESFLGYNDNCKETTCMELTSSSRGPMAIVLIDNEYDNSTKMVDDRSTASSLLTATSSASSSTSDSAGWNCTGDAVSFWTASHSHALNA